MNIYPNSDKSWRANPCNKVIEKTTPANYALPIITAKRGYIGSAHAVQKLKSIQVDRNVYQVKAHRSNYYSLERAGQCKTQNYVWRRFCMSDFPHRLPLGTMKLNMDILII